MRPFFVLWMGQAFSLLGSQLVQFAIVWWLTTMTGSATALAMASLAALLPQILVGPFAGALADRWSRKTVMVAADATVALATLVLAVLFWLRLAVVWSIYVLLLVRATGAAFHWPAMQASTTLMVPEKHLSRIAGLNQMLSGLAGILIPPLGALTIEILPMQGILTIDVATAVVAIMALWFIAVPQPARRGAPLAAGSRPTLWGDMREGLHFVLSWKALMKLSVIGMLVNMLGRAAASLSPLLVVQHFGGGALELGWWQSAVAVGSVIGGLSLGIWGGSRRRVATQMLALALDGLAIITIGLSPRNALPLALVVVFLTGVLEAIVLGLSGAISQAIVPVEVQGRVFSLLVSLTQGLALLGLLVAGPTADALGIRFWWVLTGIVIAALGTSAFFIPTVMHIERNHGGVVACK